MAYGGSCHGVHGVANGSVGQTRIMGVNKIVALWTTFSSDVVRTYDYDPCSKCFASLSKEKIIPPNAKTKRCNSNAASYDQGISTVLTIKKQQRIVLKNISKEGGCCSSRKSKFHNRDCNKNPKMDLD
ncbi:hypothetical protein VNO78_25514 [Psophocarpus tetragonolobus]|uniref:Uncharacterized protein n=1 Tax=Psophocarpus tetragonolobus TaxID=3891 RepID=A0AAN9S7I9_PSOTE